METSKSRVSNVLRVTPATEADDSEHFKTGGDNIFACKGQVIISFSSDVRAG